MAQTLGQAARQYTPEFDKTPVGLPNVGAALANGEFEYADLTTVSPVASGGNGDFGYGRNYFRAVVNLKTFTQGTAASAFAIQVADDAAMSVNLRTLGIQVIPAAAGQYCVVLQGVCPDGPRRFAAVLFLPGAGASGTFDAFLSGCP